MEAGNLPNLRDVRWRWIAYCTSLIVIGAGCLAFFCEIEIKRDVPCEIVSSSDTKVEGLEGLVSAVYVKPAQRVRQGEPLFQLARDLSLSSDGRQRAVFDEQMRDAQIAEAERQIRERAQALEARAAALRRTQAEHVAEIGAIAGQDAQNQRIAVEARRKLARINGVADYVTADRVEQARVEVHQADLALAQGAARRYALSAEMATLRGSREELAAQARELQAQRARDVQAIQMRFEQARQSVVISAPRAGVVAFSSLVVGRTLTAGEVAMVVDAEPHQPLLATLQIPSRQRGFVKEGQTIRIKLDAFPYARFGSYEARIDSISGTTMGAPARAPARDAAKDPEQDGANYLAWATLRSDVFDSRRQLLRILPGMRGVASIVVERRTIAEWVLAPLFEAIRG